MQKAERRTGYGTLFGAPMVIILSLFCLSGCGLKPQTLGELNSGYTYIPIDPTKVEINSKKCKVAYANLSNGKTIGAVKLLDMLPDNAVRLSMELSDSKGNVAYGVSKIDTVGSSYKLTADYVNSDTVNKNVWIRKTMLAQSITFLWKIRNLGPDIYTDRIPVRITDKDNDIIEVKSGKDISRLRIISGTALYDVKTSPSRQEIRFLKQEGYEEYNIPVYIGIGLRIVAEGRSISADASISGIGVIGAEADAKKLVGSLTVQTLGINSQAVSAALPVHSDLSRTTAENSFVALGSIKALLHEQNTINSPRVVGLYLPVPGGKALVNALISELSKDAVEWCPNGYTIPEPNQAPDGGNYISEPGATTQASFI